MGTAGISADSDNSNRKRAGWRRNEIDMLHGNLVSGLLMFAIPLMLTNILQLMFNAADMAVVGRFVGKESLAAVGSTHSIVMLLINTFIGISIGANIVSAQLLGEGDRQRLEKVIHTAVAVSLLSGLFLAAAGNLVIRAMLEKLGSPADVIDKSEIYLRIYFLGMPVTMLYNFAAAILRAFGDTRRPMIYLMISGAVNLLLNIIFVTVFRWDTMGVAIATVMSQAVSAVLVTRCLLQLDEDIRLRFNRIRICAEELLWLLRVGLPSGLQQITFSFTQLMVQAMVNTYGAVVMAASTASSQVENITFFAMTAFQFACISFVGQNYGAKNFDRIKKIMWTSALLATAFGIAVGYGSIALGGSIFRIFTTDPEVIMYARRKLSIICSLYFISGITDVFSGGIRGLGHAFRAMVNAVIGVCGFRLLYIFVWYTRHPSFENLMYTYPLSYMLTAVIQGVSFALLFKKLKKEWEIKNREPARARETGDA